MTPKELSTPRFKVIADWMGNKYMPVGTILTLNDEKETTCDGELATVIIVPSDIDENDFTLPFMVNEKEFLKYPCLFKSLQWFEERKPEDMPDYVKAKNDPKKILKVDGFGTVGDNGRIHFGYLKKDGTLWTIPASQLLPATEQEYLSQLK